MNIILALRNGIIVTLLALFVALAFIRRLYGACAHYRNLFVSESRKTRALERERNELRRTVADLAAKCRSREGGACIIPGVCRKRND